MVAEGKGYSEFKQLVHIVERLPSSKVDDIWGKCATLDNLRRNLADQWMLQEANDIALNLQLIYLN